MPQPHPAARPGCRCVDALTQRLLLSVQAQQRLLVSDLALLVSKATARAAELENGKELLLTEVCCMHCKVGTRALPPNAQILTHLCGLQAAVNQLWPLEHLWPSDNPDLVLHASPAMAPCAAGDPRQPRSQGHAGRRSCCGTHTACGCTAWQTALGTGY